MLISNSLLISSANLVTIELDEPPKTISSMYTSQLGYLCPASVETRSDQPSPSQNLSQTRTPSTYHTKL
jgi:hypothetical protein